jgi:hypothetical protein
LKNNQSNRTSPVSNRQLLKGKMLSLFLRSIDNSLVTNLSRSLKKLLILTLSRRYRVRGKISTKNREKCCEILMKISKNLLKLPRELNSNSFLPRIPILNENLLTSKMHYYKMPILLKFWNFMMISWEKKSSMQLKIY